MSLLGASVGLVTLIVMVMSFLTPYWRGQARFVQILAVIHFFAWSVTQVFESPPVLNGIPVFIVISTMMFIIAVMNMYDHFKFWKAALVLVCVLGAMIDITISAHGQRLSPTMYLVYATANNAAFYITLLLISYGSWEKTIWRFGRKRGWIKPVPSAFATMSRKKNPMELK